MSQQTVIVLVTLVIYNLVLIVFFNAMGAVEPAGLDGVMRLFSDLARLPGDPFERVVPWLPALAILWFGRVRAAEAGGGATAPCGTPPCHRPDRNIRGCALPRHSHACGRSAGSVRTSPGPRFQ